MSPKDHNTEKERNKLISPVSLHPPPEASRTLFFYVRAAQVTKDNKHQNKRFKRIGKTIRKGRSHVKLSYKEIEVGIS